MTGEELGRTVSGNVTSTERTRTTPLRNPHDPSLRINNGNPPFHLGDVNGERDEVPAYTHVPPSNGERLVEGGSRRAPVERAIHEHPTNDIPLRFHAGRESLSVKKNITVRDLKRQKERTLDREYKQRYSVSPGHQVQGSTHEPRGYAIAENRTRGTTYDDRMSDTLTSSSSTSSPIKLHSPTSVPSPRNGACVRHEGSP